MIRIRRIPILYPPWNKQTGTEQIKNSIEHYIVFTLYLYLYKIYKYPPDITNTVYKILQILFNSLAQKIEREMRFLSINLVLSREEN